MNGHVADRLSAYLDGALRAAEAERVRVHLERCAQCRGEWEALRRTVALLRTLPEQEVPAGFRARVMERVAASSRQPAVTRAARAARWPRLAAWAAAAAVAATVLGAVLQATVLRAPQAALPGPQAALGQGAGAAGLAADTEAAGAGGAPGPAAPPAGIMKAPATGAAPPGAAADVSRGLPVELGRKIAQTAFYRIEVADVVQAARAAEEAAVPLGGYVQDALIEGRPGGTARMTLRVPAERFAELDRRLTQLGTVLERRLGSEDLTASYVDVESRVRTLRAQEARLLELVRQARTVDEVLRVEQELWRVRGDIESLQGQLRAWDRMVQLSTASVEFVPEGGARPLPPGGAGDRLRRAWQRAMDAALLAVEAMLVGAAFLLPWAVPAGLGWWAYRRLRAARGPGV